MHRYTTTKQTFFFSFLREFFCDFRFQEQGAEFTVTYIFSRNAQPTVARRLLRAVSDARRVAPFKICMTPHCTQRPLQGGRPVPRTSVQRAPKPNSGWALSSVHHRRRTEHCGLLRASKRAALKTGTPSGHPHFSGVRSPSPQPGRGRQVPSFLVNNARDVRLTVPDCVTTACDSQPNTAQHSRPICGPG